MNDINKIYFLHISDFHVGKESYPQSSMFNEILNKLDEQINNGKTPDFVFITGDIANKAKNEEYELFLNMFITPMLDLFGTNWSGDIYSIPGNHDVDRNAAEAVQKHGVLERIPNFLDPSEAGLYKREPLLCRFESYKNNDPSTKIDCNWVFSEEGLYTDVVNKKGINFGIIGVNTAWLSENDSDRNKITPGYNLLNKGFQKVLNTDMKIVLGHHPISWYRDQDQKSISTLFGKNKIIYLHGHLHEPGACYLDGGGCFFRSIQAGASYQVRPEDKILKNYILFGEISREPANIGVEPFQWSSSQNEWVLATDTFPDPYFNRKKLQWVLTDKVIDSSQIDSSPEKFNEKRVYPKGWLKIDSQFLTSRKRPLKAGEVLGYFDGLSPTWKHALSPDIPHRQIVHELYNSIISSNEQKENHVLLLSGAGGEGKSTIIKQLVCKLIENNICNVLWHNDTESGLANDFYKSLNLENKPWVIISDDADIIVSDLFNAVREISISQTPGIHFVLCARQNDWIIAKGQFKPWHNFSIFKQVNLRGLSKEDSRLIVESWRKYGDKGLGKLRGLGKEAAIARLAKEAESELYPEDGAFLGAMLRTRYGSALKDHVLELLKRIEKRKAPGGNLLKAFTYIAALHAENRQILSKIVLAEILGCETKHILKKVLGPLGEEAAAVKTGKYILTRHRAIAEASIELLNDVFHEDLDDIYVEIVQAAQKVRFEGNYVFFLGEYADLPERFFDKGQEELGIRMAKAQLDINPKNPFLITRLSDLYRKAGSPEKSIEIFRNAPVDLNRTRAFYYEWGTSEYLSGYPAFAAYLDILSLSDNIEKAPPDNDRAKTSLRGICVSFMQLYDKYNDIRFVQGVNFATKFIDSLKIDDNDYKFFLSMQNKAIELSVKENDSKLLFDSFKEIVSIVWELLEVEPAIYLKTPDILSFKGLKYILKINDRFKA